MAETIPGHVVRESHVSWLVERATNLVGQVDTLP